MKKKSKHMRDIKINKNIHIDKSGLKTGEKFIYRRDDKGRTIEIEKKAACFPAGTIIETPSGVIDIESTKAGDLVLAYDPYKNELRHRSILKVCNYGKNLVWEIKFKDGSQLRTTASHALRVGKWWKKASCVDKGDLICCIDSSRQVVTKQVVYSSATTDIKEVFNLIVDGEFSFVASGVVAHSFSYLRLVRCLWWTIYSTLSKCFGSNPTALPYEGRIPISQGFSL